MRSICTKIAISLSGSSYIIPLLLWWVKWPYCRVNAVSHWPLTSGKSIRKILPPAADCIAVAINWRWSSQYWVTPPRWKSGRLRFGPALGKLSFDAIHVRESTSNPPSAGFILRGHRMFLLLWADHIHVSHIYNKVFRYFAALWCVKSQKYMFYN